VGTRFSFADPIELRRVRLRPLGERDVAALVAYRSDPDVCRWVPFAPMGVDVVRERLASQWTRLELAGEGDVVEVGVELMATGELVGDVMLRWSSEVHRRAEVGYVLNPEHQGNGYATEAVHGLLHVAFDDLGLHRVTASICAPNTASVAVATRLGLREESHFVEGEWFKGAWVDELEFAILDREWHARRDPHCS
jgi:RimJ/RimL family protein N-acetyltransferase